MAQAKPILYSYFRSSCSWRVRITLAIKGIDYDYKAVDLLKGEQNSSEFKKINPAKEVPVFVDDGKILTQSLPILEYLEETRPNPRILPQDPVARAQVRALVNIIVLGIQPLQNDKVLKRVNDDSDAWGKYWIEKGFESLETHLKTTHGTYSVGDTITMADICLVPQVFNANLFGVDMSQFPIIQQIYEKLSESKHFKDSHPSAQLDCPKNFKC